MWTRGRRWAPGCQQLDFLATHTLASYARNGTHRTRQVCPYTNSRDALTQSCFLAFWGLLHAHLQAKLCRPTSSMYGTHVPQACLDLLDASPVNWHGYSLVVRELFALPPEEAGGEDVDPAAAAQPGQHAAGGDGGEGHVPLSHDTRRKFAARRQHLLWCTPGAVAAALAAGGRSGEGAGAGEGGGLDGGGGDGGGVGGAAAGGEEALSEVVQRTAAVLAAYPAEAAARRVARALDELDRELGELLGCDLGVLRKAAAGLRCRRDDKFWSCKPKRGASRRQPS